MKRREKKSHSSKSVLSVHPLVLSWPAHHLLETSYSNYN